jgi:hypothetical protein
MGGDNLGQMHMDESCTLMFTVRIVQ